MIILQVLCCKWMTPDTWHHIHDITIWYCVLCNMSLHPCHWSIMMSLIYDITKLKCVLVQTHVYATVSTIPCPMMLQIHDVRHMTSWFSHTVRCALCNPHCRSIMTSQLFSGWGDGRCMTSHHYLLASWLTFHQVLRCNFMTWQDRCTHVARE